MELNTWVSYQSVCSANVFLVIAEFGRKKIGQNQEHSWVFVKSSAGDLHKTCLYETRFNIQILSYCVISVHLECKSTH